jgi:hAT family protein
MGRAYVLFDLPLFISDLFLLPVLDPRISYEGLKADYADDLILSDHLEGSKSKLFDYFNANYANAIPTPPSSSPPSTRVQPTPLAGSPQKSFTARYRRKEKTSVNELEAYFKLPTEDFEACNPIHWWIGRRAQFPNLFCMARDILCIPGKFLLVSLIQVALTCLQVLLSPLRESSRVVATQYPFGALAFMPTRSEYLCLSRSGCTLRVPKPTPPCGIDSVPVPQRRYHPSFSGLSSSSSAEGLHHP